jgi:uncharacterized membrane-anchored protein YitT (DUF2179 family)
VKKIADPIRKLTKSEAARIRRVIRNAYIRDFFLILTGVLSATLGLKGFLLPNSFLDGGVTGISLLVNSVSGVSLSWLVFIFNVPFILIGFRQVSASFAIKTLLAVIALSLAIKFIPVPIVTADKLLIAVFGGVFLGAGIGLAIRGGSVIDGTEVLAIQVSRNSNMSVGDFIAIFNIALFGVAAVLINLETAMYSILTYLAASKSVDFLVNGIEEYIGVTIISSRPDELSQQITSQLGRAITIYKGESAYMKDDMNAPSERKILFAVVTRLEVQRLLIEIDKIDPSAFVTQHTINHTRGGMVKKRPLH